MYNITPEGNLNQKELYNLVDMSKDLLQGDNDASLLKEFTQADLLELKKAYNIILSDPNLSDTQVTNLIGESWRMLYYQRPPSIEEFLSPEWLGATSQTIRPHIREWLCEWYNPEKAHRHCMLSCAIGMGKSYFSVLNSLYVSTNIALMRNPWKTMSSILGEASPIAIIFVSFSIDKVTEILIEPFKQFLFTSPKFKKVKTLEIMNRIANEEKGRIIPWTTAGETNILTIGNPLPTASINIKVASDPARLLGLTLVQTIFTELSFFNEKGKSNQYIWRLYTDSKARVKSRFPNQEKLKYTDKFGNLIAPETTFFARTIMDSSPNSWESPIDKYIYNGEADKNPEVLLFRGSTWEIMPKSVPDIDVRFPVFVGGASKSPRIITEPEIKNYDPKDVIQVPKFFLSEFEENLGKALKDRAGIPSSGQDILIENIDTIENMFVDSLRNIYSFIQAPHTKTPERLIWDQIKDTFFIRIRDRYEFYRNPKAIRYVSIDQSKSGDATCVGITHEEVTEQGDIIYVNDMTVVVVAVSEKINLESLKCFIEDLIDLGGLTIGMVSYDSFQSESSIQSLERRGIPVRILSVDLDPGPYLNLASLLSQGRLKAGRNIFIKNNLRSLIRTLTPRSKKLKIDHILGEAGELGDLDWNTSLMGYYAKDATDTIAASVALCQRFGTHASNWIWKEDDKFLQMKEVVLNKLKQDLLASHLKTKPRTYN